MKKLYLHIGSHKTATTFLQSSFAQNRPILNELGILYPDAGRIYEAHFKLTWALKDPTRKLLPLGELVEWAALFEEIDAAPQDVIVISSEEFSFGHRNEPRLAALADRYDVRVIYYLRSTDSYLESFYNQNVKDFGTRETRRIETFMGESELVFLDTMRVLKSWAEMFGKDAIRLRLFGQEFLKNGILQDFLETIECSRFPEFRPAGQAQEQKISLPPDALDYLRLSNKWLIRETNHYQFVIDLVRMSATHNAELQQTRSGMLSLRTRQELRKRFRDSNYRAAKTYLDAGRTPFPPMEAPSPQGFNERLVEANADIMGHVAALIRDAQT